MSSILNTTFASLALGLFISLACSAQDTPKQEEDIPVAIVETLPAWQTCASDPSVAPDKVRTCTEQAIANFVVSNLAYPKKARRKGIEGQIIVKFIVEKDGALGEVTVVKGVHPMLDDEVQRGGKHARFSPRHAARANPSVSRTTCPSILR